jgi:hypothetical protein
VWVAVIEDREAPSQPSLFGHVTRVLPIQVHDMRVCTLSKKKIDRLYNLVLDAQVQCRIAVAVHVVDVGTANDQPIGTLEVFGKQEMHEDGDAVCVLLVEPCVAQAQVFDHLSQVVVRGEHDRRLAVSRLDSAGQAETLLLHELKYVQFTFLYALENW